LVLTGFLLLTSIIIAVAWLLFRRFLAKSV
jgi:hypothetical protein